MSRTSILSKLIFDCFVYSAVLVTIDGKKYAGKIGHGDSLLLLSLRYKFIKSAAGLLMK